MKSSCFFSLLSVIFCFGCREQIVHDLNEREANRLISRLHDSGIEVEKKRQTDGLWSLSVAGDLAGQAVRALTTQRLLSAQVGEAKDGGPFLQSRDEGRFRYERAVSREIEKTLSGIPQVLEARVHLNMPQVDPFFGVTKESSVPSASVLLIHAAAKEMEPDRAAIAQLVSGASGIPPSQVSILMKEGGMLRESASSPLQVRPARDLAGFLLSTSGQIGGSLVVLGIGLLLSLWKMKKI